MPAACCLLLAASVPPTVAVLLLLRLPPPQLPLQRLPLPPPLPPCVLLMPCHSLLHAHLACSSLRQSCGQHSRCIGGSVRISRTRGGSRPPLAASRFAAPPLPLPLPLPLP